MNFTSNLSYVRTFGYHVFVKIPDEKRVKSQKNAVVDNREGYFIGYNSESIY